MRWYRELLPSLPGRAERLDRAAYHPAGCAVPRGAVGPQGPAASSGATPDRTTGPMRSSRPVRTYGSPLLVGMQAMPFRRAAKARSTVFTRQGCSGTGGADFFNEISDAGDRGAPQNTARSCRPVTPPCTCTLSTGAASRVPEDATRLCLQGRRLGQASSWASIPDPANAGRISQWARDYWQELHPTLGWRSLRQLPDGRGTGQDQGRPTAATTTGSPRSRTATTRTTRSTSTRTSRPASGSNP